jgi:hypothetical protein
MPTVLAILAWIVWIALSTISAYVVWKFANPGALNPPEWVVNLIKPAEFIVRVNAGLALAGVILSIILALV